MDVFAEFNSQNEPRFLNRSCRRVPDTCTSTKRNGTCIRDVNKMLIIQFTISILLNSKLLIILYKFATRGPSVKNVFSNRSMSAMSEHKGSVPRLRISYHSCKESQTR